MIDIARAPLERKPTTNQPFTVGGGKIQRKLRFGGFVFVPFSFPATFPRVCFIDEAIHELFSIVGKNRCCHLMLGLLIIKSSERVEVYGAVGLGGGI